MIELIVMRLANMHRVHPRQITLRCSKCNEEVGVFPSGQLVLKQRPDTVLTCDVCKGPSRGPVVLAPGADLEPFESVKKK